MTVTLSDEQFIRIYQAVYLGIHPGGDIPMTLMLGYVTVEMLDEMPGTEELRAAAMERIPELREEYAATRTLAPVSSTDAAPVSGQPQA